ncbi:hypothetical protein GpSGHVEth059 [Glossina pallidipes salivary gland hypertrophy virus]|uniref:Uncharacterized protein n=1 Tax=Glossina hytrovirus (isolate Glossina pallidipes/Ethiopia/Seibersdorf/-) TaxID=379529 RepID=A0A0Y0GFK8_GHVS|nr:hypothetical protein GpSGHVEth059 [Glossina pallidipes salivary gland hypertrophy virus]
MDQINATDDTKIACMKAVYDVIKWDTNSSNENYNDKSTLVEETILLMRAFGYSPVEDYSNSEDKYNNNN